MPAAKWMAGQIVNGLYVPVVSDQGHEIRVAIPSHADELVRILNTLEAFAAQWWQVYQDRCENAYVEQTVLKELHKENEATAKKLSDVWIHLDSWARGEAPNMEFIQAACKGILTYQQCPGWKQQTEAPGNK